MSRGARRAWGTLLVLWCVATWKLSSESDPESYVGLDLHLPDKLVHGVEYALGGVFAAGLVWPGRGMPAWALAVLFCSVWGVVDEIHQSYVPERESSALDVAADVAGAAAGAALFTAVQRRRQPRGRSVDESGGPMKEPT